MKSIRWRIAIPYILLSIITISGLGWYLFTQLEQRYSELQQERLLSEARLAAQGIADVGNLKDAEVADGLAKSISKTLGVRVTIIRADGVVVGDSTVDIRFMDNHLNRLEVRRAFDNQEAWEKRFSASVLTHMLYVAVPVVASDGSIPAVMRLAIPVVTLQNGLQDITRTLAFVTAGALILIIVLAFLISEYTVRPIRQLTNAAKQIGEGNYLHSPIQDRHDEIGTLSRAFHLMTDKVQEQFAALQSEHEKLQGVLSSMSDGVVIVDKAGLVQLLNPAACRLFNTTEEKAIGHSLNEILRHHQFVELWKNCRASGEQQVVTLDMAAEKLQVQAVASPLGEDLQGSTLLLLQDLTRVRKLETIRQDFVSNVSHELRTPLAAIKSLSETLQESALQDPPAARKFLTMMDKEVDTMAQVIQELLELSRIESGRAPLQKRLAGVDEMVRSTVERMRLQAERAGLGLEISIPADLPQVNVDVDRIQNVILNLVHNAIKFTLPGGKISVSARKAENNVIISIQDTGVGIPNDDLPRIFERFYKADRARAGGGTGLGLSIARHIIAAHGGKIWVESQIDEGSTFIFSLPL